MIQRPITSYHSGWRKAKDRIFFWLVCLFSALTAVPLVVIIWEVVRKGYKQINLNFFHRIRCDRDGHEPRWRDRPSGPRCPPGCGHHHLHRRVPHRQSGQSGEHLQGQAGDLQRPAGGPRCFELDFGMAFPQVADA